MKPFAAEEAVDPWNVPSFNCRSMLYPHSGDKHLQIAGAHNIPFLQTSSTSHNSCTQHHIITTSTISTMSMETTMIKTPGAYDILCGKSNECNNCQGSQRYRLVIDAYRERYASASTRVSFLIMAHQILAKCCLITIRFLPASKVRHDRGNL